MLDLRQLSALRSVSEQRSIARAARTLGWSQPTIAHHLKGLEIVLGAAAVTSDASGTRLTPAGQRLLPHAVAILDRAVRAVADVTELVNAKRRSISLGIFPSAGARLLPTVVQSLRDADYDPCVREAELTVLLHEVESMSLDAAIIYSDPQQPTILPAPLRTYPLFTEQFFLIVPVGHPLAGRTEVDLNAFAAEKWILGASINDPCDAALLTAAAQLNFTPRVTIRSDDYSVITGYVEAGFGVALVPELALPARIDSVSVLRLRDRNLMRELSLIASEYVDDTVVSILSAAAKKTRPVSDGGRPARLSSH